MAVISCSIFLLLSPAAVADNGHSHHASVLMSFFSTLVIKDIPLHAITLQRLVGHVNAQSTQMSACMISPVPNSIGHPPSAVTSWPRLLRVFIDYTERELLMGGGGAGGPASTSRLRGGYGCRAGVSSSSSSATTARISDAGHLLRRLVAVADDTQRSGGSIPLYGSTSGLGLMRGFY